MGVVVSPFRTQISDCETTTGWSGGGVLNDSFQLQGTNCLGEKVSQTTSSEHLFTFASNQDMTDKFVVMPMSVTGAADTKVNGGYRIILIDGAGDKGTWYVGGIDTTRERWTYFTVAPSTAPTFINGSANNDLGVSSITRSGTTATLTTSSAHGLATNDFVIVVNADQEEYNGHFQITVTGTTTFTYVMSADPGASATGSPEARQGINQADIDQVGVQGKVTTKAVGNTPNFFWDICWFGDGLQVTSTTDSVTLTRSGSTVTVASTAHGLAVGDRVRIAGANETEYNGDHTITAVLTNSYDYEIVGTPSTPATGTITSRVHVTWDHIAAEDDAGFWGLCVKTNGSYILQGRFVLGSLGSAADLLFVDSNFIAIFRENEFLPPDKNNILGFKHASGDLIDIETEDSVISAFNTRWGFDAAFATSNFPPSSVLMGGMTFDGLNSFAGGSDSNYTYTNIKFNRYAAILPEGATYDVVSLKNADADSLGMFITSDVVDSQLTNFTFSNGGLYHVSFLYEVDSFDFDNWTFDDTAVDVLYLAGVPAPATVTSITRSGSTATVTTSAAHGLASNQYVEILGANETDYNGDFQITVTGASTFTYTVAGTPTTPATGTITWEQALIINQLNGSNGSTELGVPGGAVIFKSSVVHTVSNLRTGDRVIWIRVSDGVELENVVETGGTAAYAYNYVSDTDVYVQVLSGDNLRKNTVTEVTLGNINAGFPAVQAVDNVYLNP